MFAMFSGCSSLKSINLSSFDTSSVTNMLNLFYNCSSLTSIDVSFNTSNVMYLQSMLPGCSSLESIDISNFILTKVSFFYMECLKIVIY